MTPDPYPDLLAVELPDTAFGSDDRAPDERPELSETEHRLLDALSQPQPPVVTAVEDEPRTVRGDREAPLAASGPRSPLAPVFREPTG